MGVIILIGLAPALNTTVSFAKENLELVKCIASSKAMKSNICVLSVL
jgi:hypothetical protein